MMNNRSSSLAFARPPVPPPPGGGGFSDNSFVNETDNIVGARRKMVLAKKDREQHPCYGTAVVEQQCKRQYGVLKELSLIRGGQHD